MNAKPLPNPDHAELASALEIAVIASPHPVSLADANSAGNGDAPPHLLWKSLETAFSGPEIDVPVLYGTRAPSDERLAGYIALPIALGLSLVLWVAIVELVLMR